MISLNLQNAKSIALAAIASAYSIVMLLSLSGVNGAAVGQLII